MTDDPRKTAALAAAAIRLAVGTRFVGDSATARRILRDPAVVQAGGGPLDAAAFRFTVAVAAEVIGLDAGDLGALSDRIAATIRTDGRKPVKNADDAACKLRRREDVISRLLDEGMSDTFIRTEARGYAIA